jgi:hypothetical protein
MAKGDPRGADQILASIDRPIQRASDLAHDLVREVTRACRGEATLNLANAIVRELAAVRRILTARRP